MIYTTGAEKESAKSANLTSARDEFTNDEMFDCTKRLSHREARYEYNANQEGCSKDRSSTTRAHNKPERGTLSNARSVYYVYTKSREIRRFEKIRVADRAGDTSRSYLQRNKASAPDGFYRVTHTFIARFSSGRRSRANDRRIDDNHLAHSKNEPSKQR